MIRDRRGGQTEKEGECGQSGDSHPGAPRRAWLWRAAHRGPEHLSVTPLKLYWKSGLSLAPQNLQLAPPRVDLVTWKLNQAYVDRLGRAQDSRAVVGPARSHARGRWNLRYVASTGANLDLRLASGIGGWGGQSCGTEPWACGARCHLHVERIRTKLNCRTPGWHLRVAGMRGGRPHSGIGVGMAEGGSPIGHGRHVLIRERADDESRCAMGSCKTAGDSSEQQIRPTSGTYKLIPHFFSWVICIF